MSWPAHARRKFFDLARLNKSPIAIEAVKSIDALFDIERDINGKPPPARQRIRNEHSRPLVTELETWLRQQRAKLSAKNEVAKAIANSLNQGSGLTRGLFHAASRSSASPAKSGLAIVAFSALAVSSRASHSCTRRRVASQLFSSWAAIKRLSGSQAA